MLNSETQNTPHETRSPNNIHSSATTAAATQPTSTREKDRCKVCQRGRSRGNPLFQPCACKGSIGHVHEGCLFTWMKTTKSLKCSVCHVTISASKVYDATVDDPNNACVLIIVQRAFLFLIRRAAKYLTRSLFFFTLWFVLYPLVCVAAYMAVAGRPTYFLNWIGEGGSVYQIVDNLMLYDDYESRDVYHNQGHTHKADDPFIAYLGYWMFGVLLNFILVPLWLALYSWIMWCNEVAGDLEELRPVRDMIQVNLDRAVVQENNYNANDAGQEEAEEATDSKSKEQINDEVLNGNKNKSRKSSAVLRRKSSTSSSSSDTDEETGGQSREDEHVSLPHSSVAEDTTNANKDLNITSNINTNNNITLREKAPLRPTPPVIEMELDDINHINLNNLNNRMGLRGRRGNNGEQPNDFLDLMGFRGHYVHGIFHCILLSFGTLSFVLLAVSPVTICRWSIWGIACFSGICDISSTIGLSMYNYLSYFTSCCYIYYDVVYKTFVSGNTPLGSSSSTTTNTSIIIILVQWIFGMSLIARLSVTVIKHIRPTLLPSALYIITFCNGVASKFAHMVLVWLLTMVVFYFVSVDFYIPREDINNYHHHDPINKLSSQFPSDQVYYIKPIVPQDYDRSGNFHNGSSYSDSPKVISPPTVELRINPILTHSADQAFKYLGPVDLYLCQKNKHRIRHFALQKRRKEQQKRLSTNQTNSSNRQINKEIGNNIPRKRESSDQNSDTTSYKPMHRVLYAIYTLHQYQQLFTAISESLIDMALTTRNNNNNNNSNTQGRGEVNRREMDELVRDIDVCPNYFDLSRCNFSEMTEEERELVAPYMIQSVMSFPEKEEKSDESVLFELGNHITASGVISPIIIVLKDYLMYIRSSIFASSTIINPFSNIYTFSAIITKVNFTAMPLSVLMLYVAMPGFFLTTIIYTIIISIRLEIHECHFRWLFPVSVTESQGVYMIRHPSRNQIWPLFKTMTVVVLFLVVIYRGLLKALMTVFPMAFPFVVSEMGCVVLGMWIMLMGSYIPLNSIHKQFLTYIIVNLDLEETLIRGQYNNNNNANDIGIDAQNDQVNRNDAGEEENRANGREIPDSQGPQVRHPQANTPQQNNNDNINNIIQKSVEEAAVSIDYTVRIVVLYIVYICGVILGGVLLLTPGMMMATRWDNDFPLARILRSTLTFTGFGGTNYNYPYVTHDVWTTCEDFSKRNNTTLTSYNASVFTPRVGRQEAVYAEASLIDDVRHLYHWPICSSVLPLGSQRSLYNKGASANSPSPTALMLTGVSFRSHLFYHKAQVMMSSIHSHTSGDMNIILNDYYYDDYNVDIDLRKSALGHMYHKFRTLLKIMVAIIIPPFIEESMPLDSILDNIEHVVKLMSYQMNELTAVVINSYIFYCVMFVLWQVFGVLWDTMISRAVFIVETLIKIYTSEQPEAQNNHLQNVNHGENHQDVVNESIERPNNSSSVSQVPHPNANEQPQQDANDIALPPSVTPLANREPIQAPTPSPSNNIPITSSIRSGITSYCDSLLTWIIPPKKRALLHLKLKWCWFTTKIWIITGVRIEVQIMVTNKLPIILTEGDLLDRLSMKHVNQYTPKFVFYFPEGDLYKKLAKELQNALLSTLLTSSSGETSKAASLSNAGTGGTMRSTEGQHTAVICRNRGTNRGTRYWIHNDAVYSIDNRIVDIYARSKLVNIIPSFLLSEGYACRMLEMARARKGTSSSLCDDTSHNPNNTDKTSTSLEENGENDSDKLKYIIKETCVGDLYKEWVRTHIDAVKDKVWATYSTRRNIYGCRQGKKKVSSFGEMGDFKSQNREDTEASRQEDNEQHIDSNDNKNNSNNDNIENNFLGREEAEESVGLGSSVQSDLPLYEEGSAENEMQLFQKHQKQFEERFRKIEIVVETALLFHETKAVLEKLQVIDGDVSNASDTHTNSASGSKQQQLVEGVEDGANNNPQRLRTTSLDEVEMLGFYNIMNQLFFKSTNTSETALYSWKALYAASSIILVAIIGQYCTLISTEQFGPLSGLVVSIMLTRVVFLPMVLLCFVGAALVPCWSSWVRLWMSVIRHHLWKCKFIIVLPFARAMVYFVSSSSFLPFPLISALMSMIYVSSERSKSPPQLASNQSVNYDFHLEEPYIYMIIISIATLGLCSPYAAKIVKRLARGYYDVQHCKGVKLRDYKQSI